MRLGALLLAAGGATRFGSPKLCAQIDGKAVIAHSIDALLPVFGDNLYCVLGSDADRVEKFVQGRCHLLHHENWQQGIGTTISFGIKCITAQHAWDGLLIALADQVCVKKEHYQQLIDSFDGYRLSAAFYADAPGVPALFPPEWYERLIALEGDQGAAKLIRATGAELTRVPMPEAVVDIDRPEDIERIGAKWPKTNPV